MTGMIMGLTDSFVSVEESEEFDRQTVWFKVERESDGLDIEIHREEPVIGDSREEAIAFIHIDFFHGQIKVFPYDEHTPLEYEQDPITLVENVREWKPIPEKSGEEIRRVARFVQHGLNKGRGRKK